MIKYGQTFPNRNAATQLFGIPFPPGGGGGGRVIINDILSAWFPHRAIVVNGLLTAPDNIGWLNIVDDDEEEITEVDLTEGTPTPLADKSGGHRLVFLLEGGRPYRFIGVYTLAYLSPSLRTRVFIRLSKDFLLDPSNLIAAPANLTTP